MVNLTLNGKATKAFGKLTATQASKYTPNASTNADDAVLSMTAIVLDGNVVSAPQTTEAIPGGQVQITGLGSARPRPPSWPRSSSSARCR